MAKETHSSQLVSSLVDQDEEKVVSISEIISEDW